MSIDRTIRHARQRYALALSAKANARTTKAEARADRRAGAGRRALVEALRLADLAEA